MSASSLTSFPCFKVNSSSMETSQASQVKQEKDSGKRHPWLMVKNNSPFVVPGWLIGVNVTTGSIGKAVRSNIDSNVKSNVTISWKTSIEYDTDDLPVVSSWCWRRDFVVMTDSLLNESRLTCLTLSFSQIHWHTLMITHGNCKQSRVITAIE